MTRGSSGFHALASHLRLSRAKYLASPKERSIWVRESSKSLTMLGLALAHPSVIWGKAELYDDAPG